MVDWSGQDQLGRQNAQNVANYTVELLEQERHQADQISMHNGALVLRNQQLEEEIARLEAHIARLDFESKYMTARDAALIAEIRALIDVIRECPEEYGGILMKDPISNTTRLNDIYDDTFVEEANKLGIKDPESMLPKR